ncbi:RagB/SusD family nutrient uptake outer membrane protein [Dinghuibacter silviterrae]|uniref:Putative outer membrane starch-binding protein n=1 Tax=Dinghuibacter silviterrae TaxID=1539049 RepID=A0A4R8DEB1_9BACT|nr:RagB/SusD family nutrient uptake outer membrane protein [Dinghuibacter silviterrae]TDW95861.1 putative outer membrane starch-binding protein [Dinghuibacter silviterrae]
MNKIIIVAGCLAIACLTSCKKYIDKGPIDSTYGSEFWTSQSAVEQAAISMYGQFRICLRSSNAFFTNGDFVVGIFSSQAWNYTPLSPANGSDFFTATADYLGDLTNWSRYYTLIAQCNLILQQVPQMPLSDFTGSDTSVRNAYIGEALFMRSLAYFFMVRNWGDPVYVTRTYDQVDYGNIPPVARTSETIALDSCLADLQTAARYLAFKGGDPTQTLRANRGTVYALMAHIYAWMHDYSHAHLACQQVIQNGGYSLEPGATYTNLWKGEASLENIMEIAMTYNANDPQFLPSAAANLAQGYANTYSAWTEAQFSFFSIFLKDSLDNQLTNTAWVADPVQIDTLFAVDANGNSSDMRFNTVLKYVNATNGDPAGYLLLKYANFAYQNPGIQQNAYISNNLALFRLADIILLDAEAQAMTGNGPAAVAEINQIRARASASNYTGPTDPTTLVDAILSERARELIGEGQTFYDMIRTDTVLHVLEEGLNYPPARVTQKGYYWPLDLGSLFALDPLLTQNPYWSSNK